jgi:hypothetical protein
MNIMKLIETYDQHVVDATSALDMNDYVWASIHYQHALNLYKGNREVFKHRSIAKLSQRIDEQYPLCNNRVLPQTYFDGIRFFPKLSHSLN